MIKEFVVIFADIALIQNNAHVAAEIAVALSDLSTGRQRKLQSPSESVAVDDANKKVPVSNIGLCIHVDQGFIMICLQVVVGASVVDSCYTVTDSDLEVSDSTPHIEY